MDLRPTDGDEKPARGEAVTNIGRTEGGFFRGAVSTDVASLPRPDAYPRLHSLDNISLPHNQHTVH
jgi:hypothetical protein